MTIASKISSAEIISQLTDSYVDQFFEVALINSPGTIYEPGVTNDATFLTSEVTPGTASYSRKILKFTAGDIAAYADKGMSLARKAAVFDHDGGATALSFSHIALLRGDGNLLSLGTTTSTPSNAIDGTYTNLPVVTTGSGLDATIDLTVSSSGTVFSLQINYEGYGYASSDPLFVSEVDLVAAGVCGVGDGNLNFSAATVTSGGSIYSVSKPNNTVNLTDANQAVMYFDIKHYGFYN